MKVCAVEGCTRDVDGPRSKYCSGQHRYKKGNDARAKRAALTTADGGGLSRLEKLGRIEKLLEENGVNLDEVGSVKGVRIKQWQAVAKGAAVKDPETGRVITQEPSRIVNLDSASVLISPSWAEGPKWELPHPPAPLKVSVPQARPRRAAKGWKTAILFPDPQFGFRRDLYDPSILDPFHDERALDVALQLAEVERPDLSILLGDVLDFASFGKYRQEAGFALTVQPTLEAAHEFIARVVALSKETRYIEGNHDRRLQNDITDNARAAFGVRRAGAPLKEWPVMSVPFLLNLDQLGVEYVGGYPAGATYINDNLAAIHGSKIGNNTRSAASMVVEDERVSVVFGHVHRIETRYRTRNTRRRAKLSVAHTPGCLCRIDGAVPGVKGSTDAFGRAVKSYEDWQTAVTIVRYEEGDGRFHLENVPIIDGEAYHAGHLYASRVTPEWVGRET